MTDFRFVGSHPEDLADGQVVAPGESVKLTKDEAAHPHNAGLIEDGKLIEKAASKPAEKEETKK